MNTPVKLRFLALFSGFEERHEQRQRLHAEKLERLRKIRSGEITVGRKGRKIYGKLYNVQILQSA